MKVVVGLEYLLRFPVILVDSFVNIAWKDLAGPPLTNGRFDIEQRRSDFGLVRFAEEFADRSSL